MRCRSSRAENRNSLGHFGEGTETLDELALDPQHPPGVGVQPFDTVMQVQQSLIGGRGGTTFATTLHRTTYLEVAVVVRIVVLIHVGQRMGSRSRGSVTRSPAADQPRKILSVRVFSHTLNSVDWNSRLERGDPVEVVAKLKAETDGNLEVAGATLAAPIVQAGLVDEYRIVVAPTAVGGGIPFFPALPSWISLRLLENRTFPGGTVLLRYEAQRD